MNRSSKATLAINVALLAKMRFGEQFQGDLIRAGVPNGTVTRALKGVTSIGLDALDDLAKALRVPTYVLLAPHLDPDDLPVLLSKRNAELARAGEIALEAVRKIQEASKQ